MGKIKIFVILLRKLKETFGGKFISWHSGSTVSALLCRDKVRREYPR